MHAARRDTARNDRRRSAGRRAPRTRTTGPSRPGRRAAPDTRLGRTSASTFPQVRAIPGNGLRSRCCCSLLATEAPAANLLQRPAGTADDDAGKRLTSAQLLAASRLAPAGPGTRIAATRNIDMTTGKQGGAAVDPDPRARLDETMRHIASPVQIRPSRLVVEFFRMCLCLKRARRRANLVVNGPSKACLRSWATTSYQGICWDSTASDAGQSRGQRPLKARRHRWYDPASSEGRHRSGGTPTAAHSSQRLPLVRPRPNTAPVIQL
jgi:hypothetical protein